MLRRSCAELNRPPRFLRTSFVTESILEFKPRMRHAPYIPLPLSKPRGSMPSKRTFSRHRPIQPLYSSFHRVAFISASWIAASPVIVEDLTYLLQRPTHPPPTPLSRRPPFEQLSRRKDLSSRCATRWLPASNRSSPPPIKLRRGKSRQSCSILHITADITKPKYSNVVHGTPVSSPTIINSGNDVLFLWSTPQSLSHQASSPFLLTLFEV